MPSLPTTGLRARTGLLLVAIGAILLLALHVRTAFLDLQAAGLILVATGLAWLWIPVRAKRTVLRRQMRGLRRYLERETRIADGSRHPLSDLLAPDINVPADRAADPASESCPPAG